MKGECSMTSTRCTSEKKLEVYVNLQTQVLERCIRKGDKNVRGQAKTSMT